MNLGKNSYYKADSESDSLKNSLQFLIDCHHSALCYLDSSKIIEIANNKFNNKFSRLSSSAIGRHLREIFGLETYNQIHSLFKDSKNNSGNKADKIINIIDPVSGFENSIRITIYTRLNDRFEMLGYLITLEETVTKSEDLDTTLEQSDSLIIQRYLSEIESSKAALSIQSKDLAEARDQAINATRAKSIFLANMSHEIRTPMNGVIGMASLLAGTSLTIEQKEYVEAIESSARSLLEIINDILDYSKIEAGKLSLYLSEVDLRKIVQETSILFRSQVQSKSIRFLINIGDTVPHIIKADDIRIKQVLNNLLSNAIKFTPTNGEIVLSIEKISGDHDNAKLRFQVRDSGIGMSEEQQSRIFEAFEQAEAFTARSYGGTGLGLSISSKIVNLMGGRLDVVSQPGKGACFYFDCLFKVKKDQKNDLPQQQLSAEQQENIELSDYPLNVLVVEDNPVNQRIAAKILEKLGHRVTLVGDGIEALEIVENKNFDIIFMDCQMPRMDGFDTTQRLRQFERLNATKKVPIIAMTANALEDDRQKCLAAGMDEHISKPFQAVDIINAIKKISSPDY